MSGFAQPPIFTSSATVAAYAAARGTPGTEQERHLGAELVVLEAGSRREREALALEAGKVAGEEAPRHFDRFAEPRQRPFVLEAEPVEP